MKTNENIFTPETAKNISVTQWFYSDFCNYKNHPVSQITSNSLRCWFTNHAEPYIGQKLLHEVTIDDCNNILYRLIEQGFSYGLVHGVYSLLTKIFRSAIAANIIEKKDYPCTKLSQICRTYKNAALPTGSDQKESEEDDGKYTLTLPNDKTERGVSAIHFSSLRNHDLAIDTIHYLKYCHFNHKSIGYIQSFASAAKVLDKFLNEKGITDYQHFEEYHGDFLLYLQNSQKNEDGEKYQPSVIRQRYFYLISLGNYLKKYGQSAPETEGAA